MKTDTQDVISIVSDVLPRGRIALGTSYKCRRPFLRHRVCILLHNNQKTKVNRYMLESDKQFDACCTM